MQRRFYLTSRHMLLADDVSAATGSAAPRVFFDRLGSLTAGMRGDFSTE